MVLGVVSASGSTEQFLEIFLATVRASGSFEWFQEVAPYLFRLDSHAVACAPYVQVRGSLCAAVIWRLYTHPTSSLLTPTFGMTN